MRSSRLAWLTTYPEGEVGGEWRCQGTEVPLSTRWRNRFGTGRRSTTRLAEGCTVDQQVEVIGRHLGANSERFVQGWDSAAAENPRPVPGRDDRWRFLVVMLDG